MRPDVTCSREVSLAAERRLARFLVPAALLAALILGGTPPVQADGLSCPTIPGLELEYQGDGEADLG